MNAKECIKMIVEIAKKSLDVNEKAFKNYGWSNNDACDVISSFETTLENAGLSLSHTFHKNGIGNNNERTISLRSTDEDGFVIDKKVAILNYTYGIYHGAWLWIEDLNGNTLYEINRTKSMR